MNFRQHIHHCQLLMLKLGSQVLVKDGQLDITKMKQLVHQIAQLKALNIQVILVSSGAVATGKSLLPSDKKTIEMMQAQSSAGQPLLMHEFTKLFNTHQIKTAQILLTHEDFKNRKRFLNARNTLLTLLEHDFVPILNENDAISFAEITVGDNDHLAAMSAQMVNADLLIILSSTDGLYTKDPNDKDAQKINYVEDESILPSIQMKSVSSLGRGGMQSKVKALLKLLPLGIQGIIAGKDDDKCILRALTEDNAGTFFNAKNQLATDRRKAWLLSTQKHECALSIDDGAFKALTNNKSSLLPKGILSVHGQFMRGDCIPILYQGKSIGFGLVEYSSTEVLKILNKKSDQIEKSLGFKICDEVIHKNNLVIKDSL